MTLLIRNGLLMTMTGDGEVRSDLLIQNGVIERIGERISPADSPDACILDAEGLVIIPGMIDMSIHDDAYPSEYLARSAASAGITTILVRDSFGNLTLVSGDDVQALPDSARMLSVTSMDDIRRIATSSAGGNERPILTGLTGELSCTEAIAESGCPVVLSAHHGECPWELAAALDSLGVPVAVASGYPRFGMKLLPIYAGLCHRAGMPRNHALCTITATPADLLGLADRGRIKAGYRGDLAIFDGDPLLLSTAHVMTILEGRIVRSA